ncbi:MAG: hypothetical protein R3E48_04450 [Burkholderiaceae bacterium]
MGGLEKEQVSLAKEIIAFLSQNPGKTDREVATALRGRSAPQQPINQAARRLESKGVLARRRRPEDALIGNYLLATTEDQIAWVLAPERKNHDLTALSEEEIKATINEWLLADGWETKVAWRKSPGIDIDARKNGTRWIIEVKGPGSRPPMRVNYFLSILGETLQRMGDSSAKYSIALPELNQYRGLWNRLPALAKDRTGISLLFVDAVGRIEEIR